jgi:hypothetical protein
MCVNRGKERGQLTCALVKETKVMYLAVHTMFYLGG